MATTVNFKKGLPKETKKGLPRKTKKLISIVEERLANEERKEKEADGKTITDLEKNKRKVNMVAEVVNEAEDSDSSSESDIDEPYRVYNVGDYFLNNQLDALRFDAITKALGLKVKEMFAAE